MMIKRTLKKHRLVVVIVVIIFKVLFLCGSEIELGPCFLQYLEPCANNSIQFFLFSSDRSGDAPVLLDNIEPMLPKHFNNATDQKIYKMIIHGYGGSLDFNGSKLIRNGIELTYLSLKSIMACVVVMIFFLNSFNASKNLHSLHNIK